MREIKLRYRVKNRKTGEVITATLSIRDIELQAFTPSIFDGFEWEILSRDLYTCRKDKNGKEIYEGDVVKDDRGIGKIIYEHNCFLIIYPEILNKFTNYKDVEIDDCEVIGNIYTTPELLEDKK